MAIGTHIVSTTTTTESGQTVQRVVDSGGNSAGAPTVAAYLALEAASSYLPTAHQIPGHLQTASVSDANAA